MDGAIWYLKKCNLFDRLTAGEAERLANSSLMRRYRRGEVIYSPAEPGETVLVLALGRVKIKSLTPDGKEAILAFIDEGEIFGELALVDGQRRHDYAEAVVDCKVLLVRRDDLLTLMESRADMALAVTRLIGWRRQRIENRLRGLLFLPSRARVARILVELVESHGKREGNSASMAFPVSHQDLASLVGVTRETVTLTLGQMQADEIIAVQRRRITIIDWAKLIAAQGDSPENDRRSGRRG